MKLINLSAVPLVDGRCRVILTLEDERGHRSALRVDGDVAIQEFTDVLNPERSVFRFEVTSRASFEPPP